MKLANIAALGLWALASVSSALQCSVGSSSSTCTTYEFASNYNCYSCYTRSYGYSVSGACDPTVTTGAQSCTILKAVVQASYTGGCTW